LQAAAPRPGTLRPIPLPAPTWKYVRICVSVVNSTHGYQIEEKEEAS
jgi:hypothetical protein